MTLSQNLLPVHKRFNLEITRGKGLYVFDEKGKKYLDFSGGIAVNTLGHCNKKMIKAITAQAKKLWHVSNIYSSSELNEYADKLIANCCSDYVFFCNSGAEAVEAAIKMIRRYQFHNQKPERNRIITFKGAFHGRTLATISAAGNEKYLEGFEPRLSGFDLIEFNDISAVKNAISDKTAGILLEPIQGEQGIIPAKKEFLHELRQICDEYDLVLAFDEVQCGMGRTGKIFAHAHYEVEPDLVALAKGMAGGFPIGACLAKEKIAQAMTYGTHGTTFGGNPMAMKLGSVVLEELLKPSFMRNVNKVSQFLLEKLEELRKKYPRKIKEIRGVGLMIGIEMNERINNLEFVEKLIQNKLLAVGAGNNTVRFLPSLIAKEKHAAEALKKFEKTLKNF